MTDRGLAVRITGRVQGVGYRAWTRREAESLGLRGWVVNDQAGHVDAVFVGSSDALARMIAASRIGPPDARVDHVDVRSIGQGAASDPPLEALSF